MTHSEETRALMRGAQRDRWKRQNGDADNDPVEPHRGMTQKQYDRYLHLRMSLPASDARRRAMEQT